MHWYFSQGGNKARGVTLIEALIAGALIALIFGALFLSLQLALRLNLTTRAGTTAVAVGNEYIEFMRSLPYDSVGTVSGIPAGLLPQNATTTRNGITFTRRVLIQYVDAPEDGLGASDTNTITADYKRAKVEVTWNIRGVPYAVSLVTNIVPPGIESLAGGGTLVVNVFDAAAAPVSNAAVRIVNASTSPTIDVTAYTNIAGVVMFPGAPGSGGYQVTATKGGYSTDQTYGASTTNPNPTPPHVSVVAGNVSTLNFAIDHTSTLTVRTVAPPIVYVDEDLFDSGVFVATATSTIIAGSALSLSGSAGSYALLGTMRSVAYAPAGLSSWSEVAWAGSILPQTNVLFSLYAVDGVGTATLIPDADLPGNSAGFATSPVDLTGLDPTIYPRLAVGITLSSAAGVDTPTVTDYQLNSLSAAALPSVPFTLTSAKNIGTDGGGQPVPKYQRTLTTNGSGNNAVSNLEWDQYTVTVNGASGYDISDSCPATVFGISPNTVSTTTVTLVPQTSHSLLVQVTTAGGVAISGASVHVTTGGVNQTKTTSLCGYAHFASLPAGGSYTVETSAPGYTTDTLTNVTVGGATKLGVNLVP